MSFDLDLDTFAERADDALDRAPVAYMERLRRQRERRESVDLDGALRWLATCDEEVPS